MNYPEEKSTVYNADVELEAQSSLIESKAEFVEFLKCLLNDYKQNKNDWGNVTIDDFLNGMIGFAIDADGYYKNVDGKTITDNPTWRFFADTLLASRVYE